MSTTTSIVAGSVSIVDYRSARWTEYMDATVSITAGGVTYIAVETTSYREQINATVTIAAASVQIINRIIYSNYVPEQLVATMSIVAGAVAVP